MFQKKKVHGFIISDKQPYNKRNLSETNKFTASIHAFHARLKWLKPEFKPDLPESGRLAGLSDTGSQSRTCSFGKQLVSPCQIYPAHQCALKHHIHCQFINCFILHNGSAICKASVWDSRHWTCVVSCLISGSQAENLPVEDGNQRLRFTPTPEWDCQGRLDTQGAAEEKTIYWFVIMLMCLEWGV